MHYLLGPTATVSSHKLVTNMAAAYKMYMAGRLKATVAEIYTLNKLEQSIHLGSVVLLSLRRYVLDASVTGDLLR